MSNYPSFARNYTCRVWKGLTRGWRHKQPCRRSVSLATLGRRPRILKLMESNVKDGQHLFGTEASLNVSSKSQIM
jgi:hypothetical protein